MGMYYGGEVVGFTYDATVKPRMDSEKIWNKIMDHKEIEFFNDYATKELAEKHINQFEKDDVLFLQWPTYSSREYEDTLVFGLVKKGIKIIGLIHDVDYIRFGGRHEKLVEILNNFHFLILPSSRMHLKLIEDGLDKNIKFAYQCAWDFLTEQPIKVNINKNSKIVYAGNLNDKKINFMHDLKTKLIVFGDTDNDVESINTNIEYKGRLGQDDLSKAINGEIGLVWSSDKYGEYENYNLPFKMSQYLASGIPIIARENTPVGDFITLWNVGKTINDISELEDAKESILKNKAFHENNIKTVAEKVKSGYFLTTATKQAIHFLEYGGN